MNRTSHTIELKLEARYAERQSAAVNLLLIVLTTWVALFPKSRPYAKLLRNLPQPDSAVLAACVGGKREV
jgi:hypothetical protein